ncbi:MAG: AAA family ATPase, partial [Methanospirillum sp.]|uniref:ATP-binding protein n=1 Tax=Methanospirillum sp. TaxID=45200 RepID=UPI00237228D1
KSNRRGFFQNILYGALNMTNEIPVYPFSAIVGQENMKDALLANIVYQSIGGVLIRGEKGTAKSTTVRAAADLLPDREVMKGCIFRCSASDLRNLCNNCREKIASGEKPLSEYIRMKVVELPLCATEDRVAGTLDIEQAITKGMKKFEPGVLAMANGNILYVDEVNLLDDHIVDLLLDAAAMGVNFVEREGISYSHPSKFLLVGTMNPEEGDLRPQLLDRFGLVVDVEGEKDSLQRAEVVRRRLDFERDPFSFRERYEPQQQTIRDKIMRAKEIIGELRPDDLLIDTAVKIALFMGVDGHRSDLTLVKTALAFAALNGQTQVKHNHVLKAASLSLPHRMRRKPFEESKADLGGIKKLIVECYEDS